MTFEMNQSFLMFDVIIISIKNENVWILDVCSFDVKVDGFFFENIKN